MKQNPCNDPSREGLAVDHVQLIAMLEQYTYEVHIFIQIIQVKISCWYYFDCFWGFKPLDTLRYGFSRWQEAQMGQHGTAQDDTRAVLSAQVLTPTCDNYHSSSQLYAAAIQKKKKPLLYVL